MSNSGSEQRDHGTAMGAHDESGGTSPRKRERERKKGKSRRKKCRNGIQKIFLHLWNT
ncbi:hypothetical protein ACOSQ4_028246 [Xanthoceras sorbifolium]